MSILRHGAGVRSPEVGDTCRHSTPLKSPCGKSSRSSPVVPVDIRPYGVDGKTVRVQEQSGSESEHVYDALATRVITVGGTRMFAGAVLSYSPKSARRVEQAVENAPNEIRRIYDIMLADGEIDSVPRDLDEEIADELDRRLPGVLFAEWAMSVLGAYAVPLEIANTDAEAVMPTRVRFPIKASHNESTATLSDLATLVPNDHPTWTWLAPADDDDVTRERTVLGIPTLDDTHLELATNSAERARRGREVLCDALGARIGDGLAVHDTASANLEAARPIESSLARVEQRAHCGDLEFGRLPANVPYRGTSPAHR